MQLQMSCNKSKNLVILLRWTRDHPVLPLILRQRSRRAPRRMDRAGAGSAASRRWRACSPRCGRPKQGSFWRKLLAFLGPGYLVAVGYMDPGNWATSLAGGSKFGYALLSVALLSNVMAIVLQSLCTRLGVGAGRDLAQACRDSFPRWVSLPLWLSAEVAITATDLAEVIGTAIGLNLLFHIPLEIGVIITAADVFLILALQAFGFRWIEAFVVAMLGVIAACFAVQIALADPDWGAVHPGLCADVGHLRQSRDAVSGARHSRRDRDAA